LTPSFEGNPFTQGHEILSRNTRDLEAANSEDFVILGVAVLIQCQSVTDAVAYLEGARCDGPPFGPTMKIFYRRLYMKRCVFCHFPARIAKFNNVWWFFAFPIFRKMGEFAVFIEHSEAKSVSASGGLRPLTPDQCDCHFRIKATCSLSLLTYITARKA